MNNPMKNFDFSKKYGQNFIFDSELLERIVDKSGISKADSVLEIGAGAGTLTRKIGERVEKLVSYEIDKRLERILAPLEKEMSNLTLRFNDILATPLEEIEKDFEGKYHIIANLPYYITSPIIFHFLNSEKMQSMTIMVQKEVGQRICSPCGHSEYGVLSVMVQAKCTTEILEYVGREKFTPPPNVDSVVIKLTKSDNFIVENKDAFEKTVKAAFAMKRKTLVNNLSGMFNLNRTTLQELLSALNIKETARAEELSVAQFISLSTALNKK